MARDIISKKAFYGKNSGSSNQESGSGSGGQGLKNKAKDVFV